MKTATKLTIGIGTIVAIGAALRSPLLPPPIALFGASEMPLNWRSRGSQMPRQLARRANADFNRGHFDLGHFDRADFNPSKLREEFGLDS